METPRSLAVSVEPGPGEGGRDTAFKTEWPKPAHAGRPPGPAHQISPKDPSKVTRGRPQQGTLQFTLLEAGERGNPERSHKREGPRAREGVRRKPARQERRGAAPPRGQDLQAHLPKGRRGTHSPHSPALPAQSSQPRGPGKDNGNSNSGEKRPGFQRPRRVLTICRVRVVKQGALQSSGCAGVELQRRPEAQERPGRQG